MADLGGAAGVLVSRTLGRAEPQYWARRRHGELVTAGPVRASFSSSGASVRSRTVRLDLRLIGYGRSDALTRLPRVAPTYDRNRVQYDQGAVQTWYENGPSGLEQGFIIQRAPAASGGLRRLALTLAVSGDARAARSHSGLEFSDGRSGLTYGDLSARDASGRPLASRMRVRGHRLLLEVDTSGARYPLSIDPLVQPATLTAGASNQMLESTAISSDGRTIVAGAPDSGSGHAFVFSEPATGGWANASSVAELSASDASSGDGFGTAVAISPDGGTIVVSAPAHSSSAGAAYLFQEPAGAWASEQQTTEMTGAAGADLGRSVAVSDAGDTVVVGASGVSSSAGAAYVYEKGGGWPATASPAATLRASDAASGAQFGAGTAISDNGETIAVGATFANHVGAGDSGAVYVFTSAGGWSGSPTQTAELTPSSTVASTTAWLGDSVAISGDGTTVVGGAPQSGQSSDGAVFLFTKPVAGWADEQQAAVFDAPVVDQEQLGWSVAISDDGIIVLAGTYDTARTSGGLVNEYIKPGDGWSDGTPTAVLGPGIGSSGSALFGYGVAAADSGGSPTLAIAAALQSSASAGAIDVFSEEDAPAITSAASASFSVGAPASFSVTASGTPVPSISERGSLPAGLSFKDNGDGTATLSGTATQAGSFPIVVTAVNGVSPAATQSLTINVAAAAVAATPATTSTTSAPSTPSTTSTTSTTSLPRRERPNTRITRHNVQMHRRTAAFWFKHTGINVGAVRFQCALLKLPAKHHRHTPKPHYSNCRSPKRYRHLSAHARYRFYVRARNSAGADRSPASFRFKA